VYTKHKLTKTHAQSLVTTGATPGGDTTNKTGDRVEFRATDLNYVPLEIIISIDIYYYRRRHDILNLRTGHVLLLCKLLLADWCMQCSLKQLHKIDG